MSTHSAGRVPDLPDPFEIGRPDIGRTEEFTVVPRRAGGWHAVAAAMGRLLVRCSAGGLWWATIAQLDDLANAAFAHLGPDEGGKLWTEVAGNHHLPKDQQLDEAQHALLVSLGWSQPLDEEGMQNWHRSWPAADLPLACHHVFATLVEVYGFDETQPLLVAVDPFGGDAA